MENQAENSKVNASSEVYSVPGDLDKKRRRINILAMLFVGCLGIFLVFASIVAIFYARGEVPTQTGIQKTATIRINSEPEEVKAFIDNNEVQVTERLISNIQPGDYSLRLVAEGYQPWEKEISLEEGELEEIFAKLFPSELNLSRLTQSNVDKVFYSENGEYVYYSVVQADRGSDIGVWRERIIQAGPLNLFSDSKLKITNLTPFIEKAMQAGNYELIPSSDNNKLIIRTWNKDEEGKVNNISNYVIKANVYNEPTVDFTLENLLNFPFKSVDWLEGSTTVVASGDGVLAEYNLETTDTFLIDFTPGKEPVYTVSQGKVVLYDEIGGIKSLYLYDNGKIIPIKLENIDLIDEPQYLYSSSTQSDRLIYVNSKKEAYYLDLEQNYQTRIADNIKVESISADGRTLIYSAESGEINIFNVKEVVSLRKFEVSRSVLQIPATAITVSESKESVAELNPSEISINYYNFTSTGSNLIVATDNNELYITDRDGSNWVKAISQESKYEIGTVQTNSTNRRLFVLVIEKNNNGSSLKNIYYIDLVLE